MPGPVSHLLFCLALALGAFAVHAKPLTLDIYNPGSDATFPVTSVLIAGEKELILVDAQFEKKHAEALVKKIRDSGKKLTTIYISHYEPDFYFGADHLLKAFPEAELIATSVNVSTISSAYKQHQQQWQSILGDQAPARIIQPKPLVGDTLQLEGEVIEVQGVTDPDPDRNRTFLWIPSLKTLLGGMWLTGNSHLRISDAAIAESRHIWLQVLDSMTRLEPEKVIPGRMVPNRDGSWPTDPAVISFNRDYLVKLAEAENNSENAEQLIAAMEKNYPELATKPTLVFTAKVLKGDETVSQ